MVKLFTQAEVRKLIDAAVAPLLAQIAELEAEIARLKKNSSTSSKPPSSDIVKPPRPKPIGGRRRRRRGGQPGHQRHTRPLFPPGQVNHTYLCEWPEPELTLGPDWIPLDEYHIFQQVDLLPKLFEVSQYLTRLYQSRTTGKIIAAPLPDDVKRAGLLGPRLSALVAYQKGACHMPYRVIQTFLDHVIGLSVSTGQLVKVVQKASEALAPCHAELEACLPDQPILNIDETGHPENGQKMWAWGFHVPGKRGFTWYHIDPSRGSKVLYEFLKETFSGIIGCDYASIYRKFLAETNAIMQFCWAHLIRDVKYLATLSDRASRRYGEKLLAEIKRLFRAWHRCDKMTAKNWERAARKAREAVTRQALRAPKRTDAQNVAERFRKHEECYFTFLRVPGVEPTNNAMEQRMRFLAIDRKITQGTRGERGRRWCERIWTVLTTCVQQGRSAFEFLYQALLAHLQQQPSPSLLPLPP